LLRSLESLRDKHPKRIIAVFGSAGLRDREKRRKMAEIAARRSDISIITAEDPRTEPLESILSEMTKAAVDHGAVVDQSLFVLPDRRQAIRKAVSLANEGEVVILCGKGHEQSMCFGTVEYPWDDRTALRAAIAERLGIEGPAMPWLPNGD
jgi:UDP-N-acetylmuramoyl-L-alanyl-D-glutamate--2,6-diaminopimelate ligase